MHGYGVAVRIEQVSKGVFRVNAGSLFVAFQRLQRAGLIRSEWKATENNRRARYCALTEQGQKNSAAKLENGKGKWRRSPESWRHRKETMSFLRNIAGGLRSLFRKLSGFLEMATEEKMKQGMSRVDALRVVRLERGSFEGSRPLCRLGIFCRDVMAGFSVQPAHAGEEPRLHG